MMFKCKGCFHNCTIEEIPVKENFAKYCIFDGTKVVWFHRKKNLEEMIKIREEKKVFNIFEITILRNGEPYYFNKGSNLESLLESLEKWRK